MNGGLPGRLWAGLPNGLGKTPPMGFNDWNGLARKYALSTPKPRSNQISTVIAHISPYFAKKKD